MWVFFSVLIFTLTTGSKKFDIYELNDEKKEETEKNETAKIDLNQNDTTYVEDENVSLPESFSENDYIRSFSLVKKQIHHWCYSIHWLILLYMILTLILYSENIMNNLLSRLFSKKVQVRLIWWSIVIRFSYKLSLIIKSWGSNLILY